MYIQIFIDLSNRFIQVPEVLPKASVQPTNPFHDDDFRLYANHENVFLRNISQRQSKELRNSRLLRQSSEPLNEKKPTLLQKSLSTDTEEKKPDSPPKSRIPVANFRYSNKMDIRPELKPESPKKLEELPEYTNIVHPVKDDVQTDLEKLLEKKVSFLVYFCYVKVLYVFGYALDLLLTKI